MSKKKHTLDPNAWVRLHADYLFNYTISRINNHETAKDLIQETFFAALKARNNFKGNASERTWLISILKRKIIDYYRKINSIKGKAELKMNFYEDGEREGEWIEERVPTAWKDETSHNLENDELNTVLQQCISNLPEKYEMVFRMKTMLDYDTEQICKELGITSSNLWVIIHRARTQLRRCMEKNWFNS